jgi:hypothetical protein
MSINQEDMMSFLLNMLMNMQEDHNYEEENENEEEDVEINDVLNQSLYDLNPIKNVISDTEILKLIKIKYKNAINKQQHTTCFITQDEFEDNDDIIQLPCYHCFFPDDIMQWLTEECAECPICKYKFESVEKRFFNENSMIDITNEDVINDDIIDITDENSINRDSIDDIIDDNIIDITDDDLMNNKIIEINEIIEIQEYESINEIN